MENDYKFLTDHSYSMLDHDTLSLKQRAMKTKKLRKNSIRSNKTASIDRSSSDKENNVSNPPNPSKNKTKKKPARSNLSANSRTQFKKKQNKTSLKNVVKSPQGNIIKKKNLIVNKPIISHATDTFGLTPILSIEERVKLRRTKQFIATPIKPVLNKKLPINNVKKQIDSSKAPKKPEINKKSQLDNIEKRINSSETTIKSKKFFLGSGLDLDNIVLGNRQRRSIKT
ncbi:unnamed protein product [Rotaria socialis]|uniref:Uncharacterized protein n=1 Tax=Rotaria socialis TaxID=392032 RepID=A0A820BVZ2_9BILA|nr:unnamed protein product [Rotaria socialis]CAF3323468.1 unnamed protein product [Rotaria socialis]CAF4212406.1 unnamed protein product [Rotaria socialis]CAF4250811.1 unnamed protein product [Rotaria socialis]